MIKRKRNDPKLHSFRRNLKGAWADVKKDFISGDGALASSARFYATMAVIIFLMAIAKFGFGWF